MVVVFKCNYVQSVRITTKVVSSNPVHGEVYSISTFYDKVFQSLATSRWFSPVSDTNKTERHDIAELLLKVALNTINHIKPKTIERKKKLILFGSEKL